MDWLLRRLADRLGVAPAQAGEAITPRIQFEQPWSQWALALVVLGSAALIIWLYRREGSASMPYKMTLAALRIVLILLAVFMLSEAVLSVERTGLPYFIVMADDSASANVVDQYADPKAKSAAESLAKAGGAESDSRASRVAVEKGILLKDDAYLIRTLEYQHKVKLYAVSEAARPLAEVDKTSDVKAAIEAVKTLEPKGAQTRLGRSIVQVLTELRGVPPTAVLLLSDGQTTDGEPLAKAAELAKQKGVPIFAVGIGDSEPAKDLELTDMLVDEVVFVDDLVRFEVKLQAKGFANEPVTIRLGRMRPGDRFEELDTKRTTAPPDGQTRRIEITHRPKETGEITFVMKVDDKPREISKENNEQKRVVNVRKEKLKVLLVDGEPRYEFRYLKSFLERDRTIDLKVLLLSSDPEYAEQDPFAIGQFPSIKEGADGLFTYDVVILGDADPSFLNAAQMKNLVEFVTQKGGGLMFVAGENFNPLSYKRSPLEPLLPILLDDARNPSAIGAGIAAFRPNLTAEGATHPIFRFGDDVPASRQMWEKLPLLNWYFEAPKKQPAAFVLAAHPTVKAADGAPLPILLYQFNGAGKVMFSAVDDTWRWRFRVGDNGPFGRFWIQTIRFLARSKMLGQKQAEVTTDRKRYTRNQTVLVQVRFPNPGLAPKDDLNVEVAMKGKGPRKLALRVTPGAKNVFEGVLPPMPEGEYEVKLLPPPALTGGMPSTTFRVDPPAGEMERVQMNEAELRRATDLTGGKFYTAETVGSLFNDLPAPQKVPLDTDPPIAIWNSWPLLVLFLFTAALEWVFRKRKQMV